MSSAVIQYTNRKLLKVERVYSDLQMQQDRGYNDKEDKKTSKEV